MGEILSWAFVCVCASVCVCVCVRLCELADMKDFDWCVVAWLWVVGCG